MESLWAIFSGFKLHAVRQLALHALQDAFVEDVLAGHDAKCGKDGEEERE